MLKSLKEKWKWKQNNNITSEDLLKKKNKKWKCFKAVKNTRLICLIISKDIKRNGKHGVSTKNTSLNKEQLKRWILKEVIAVIRNFI